MRFTRTATILFYVNPSIETRIRKSKTIDLMEGGKEQAQNVPNLEINPCDGEGNEDHADGSSRDVPIQSDSEGAKKTLDICEDGEEGTADGSSNKNDKKDEHEEEEGESVELKSSSGEESSSTGIVPPRTRPRPRNQKVSTSTDSLSSSSDSSDSSSSPHPHQIPRTPLRAPHQIPRTPLPQAPRQISSFYSTLG
jgi:hypothetical protein